MVSAGVLLLGGLVTMGVPQGPGSGSYTPIVSCNKQGSVYNSVWVNNFNPSTSAQIVVNGSTLWTASSTASLCIPAFAPACAIDTDDTSNPGPNYAVTWCVVLTEGQSQYLYAYCSVNGHAPFQVGVYQGVNPPPAQQANNSYVALRRTPYTVGGQTVIVVAVAFNFFVVPQADCPIYGQVFYVSPSTGQPIAGGSSNPMVLNGWLSNPNNYQSAGDLAIGGIAGDDYGNFAVSYVRQYVTEYSNPVGIYASTITPSATPGVIEARLSTAGSQYCWSRIACYHGASSTSGGFVVAATPNGNGYINTYRCTTNWTSSASVVATNVTSSGNATYQFPGTPDCWQFSIACERDTPGNYMLTWPTSYVPQQYQNDEWNQGANNIAYELFASDTAQPVVMLTSYYGTVGSYFQGSPQYPPPDWGDQPSVAVADHSYGGGAQIDWIATSTSTSVGSLQTQKVSGP
jgi:hypothetical protein